jgi:ABC-2 type transport system permease protein
MSPALTLATTRRVLLQLRHDPRTVALLVVLPSLLMLLLRYVFDSQPVFSRIAPALLGILPFLLMFLVTSITTLRERSSGTLERLTTTPLGRLDLLLGYASAFGLVAVLSVVAAVGTSAALGLDLVGSFWWLLLVTVVDAVLGIATGLLASAFARTEFQAIQLMPVVVLPQLLLCGLFHPRAEMATVLRWAADVMPVSYAVEALQLVARSATVGGDYVRDVLVGVGCGVVALALGAATLRRRTE